MADTKENPSECSNRSTHFAGKDFNDPKALVKCVYHNYSVKYEYSSSDNVSVPKRSGKSYQCVECHYSTDCVSKLTRHNMTHTGEKPFECSICSSRFARKDKLERHSFTHTDKKPFQCFACNRQFTRKDHLKGHKCKNAYNLLLSQ